MYKNESGLFIDQLATCSAGIEYERVQESDYSPNI